jgi:membrane-associated phospholipid phosphatase
VGRFVAIQAVLVLSAIVAYFGVRGLTEGSAPVALRNARWVLDVERAVGLAFEQRVQAAAAWWHPLTTLGNWIYIWCHWPVVAATLIWLLRTRRDDFIELRNAIFISGAIGLVIYMSFPVAPPRLFSADYVDTVTLQSNSYRVLQPPGFVNAYAAMPSLHFGWNLLVGLAWVRVGRRRAATVAGVAMPIAMAWAVVVTGNHWVSDVAAGGLIAVIAWWLARAWRRRTTEPAPDSRSPVRTSGVTTPGADPRPHLARHPIGLTGSGSRADHPPGGACTDP